MRNGKQYYIYILTNKNNSVLYTGITGDLIKRIYQHRNKAVKGFSFRYDLNKLVYYEIFYDPESAIKREKQIKGWVRKKKIELVESMNPKWEDLSREWFEKQDS